MNTTYTSVKKSANYECTLSYIQFPTVMLNDNDLLSYVDIQVEITAGPTGKVPLETQLTVTNANNGNVIYTIGPTSKTYQIVALTLPYYNNIIIDPTPQSVPLEHDITGATDPITIAYTATINGETIQDAVTFQPASKGVGSVFYAPSSAYLGDVIQLEVHKTDPTQRVQLNYSFSNLEGVIYDSTDYDFYNGPGDYIKWIDWIPSVAEFFPYFGEENARIGEIECITMVNNGTEESPAWTEVFTSTRQFTLYLDTGRVLPLINSISTEDIDTTTVAMTGDSEAAIKHYSRVKFIFDCTSQSGGEIDLITITCEGKTYSSFYSLQNYVVVPYIPNSTVSIKVTDTNELESVYTYTIPKFYEYFKPTCHVTPNGILGNGEISFTVGGNIYDDTFGATSNEILSAAYQIVSYDSNYASGWIAVDVTGISINDNRYSFDITHTGLNYKESYYIQAKVQDKLASTLSPIVDTISEPVFDWSKTDFNFNVPVNFSENAEFPTDQTIYGVSAGGERIAAITPYNSAGNLNIGYGNYQREIGNTKLYGNNIDLLYNGHVSFNGRELGENRVLWQGGLMMTNGHTIELSEPISKQPSAIVLVFSLYRNSAAEDVSINSFFVSKKEVELLPGAPHFYFLGINAGFSSIAGKYLYISDESITGHETNDDTGSNNGISFTNSNYVLRYVIGV